MSLSLNPLIFREYDIRGAVDRDLSPEFARALGAAYVALLSQSGNSADVAPAVSVGWDCRASSPAYAAALTEGLRTAGANVIRLGVVPTPLTYFSGFHLDTAGAIMVTGSHNSATTNGFKICIGRETIHGARIQALRELMEKPVAASPRATGSVVDCDIATPYCEHLVRIARPLKRRRIVIDAANGTAGPIAPKLFERLGAEVVPLFCELDGRFPNHDPDPIVPENLRQLAAAVRRESADFGIAFDSDADRIGVVDERGAIISGDELMVIYARDLLRERPGATVIGEVKSSHRLFADIAARGGQPVMWKAGHALIKAKMRETGAALGGEVSGHVYFADRYFGFDDALYAALRLYEIASAHDGPLSSLLCGLPPSVLTPEVRIACSDALKFKLVAGVKNRLAAKHQINDIDGVRVDFGDAWGMLRASNTEAALVLRYEAPTEARLREVEAVFETALEEARLALGNGAAKGTE